ncbi:hypothetical protein [Pararhizobium arenae]|uniref:hypothetical protein n=1 Tax=Pararhizobium arenae TaxID=1856850 RepID=UPI00094B0242|nr:hypothetical protein [Pararhizobium arenae]
MSIEDYAKSLLAEVGAKPDPAPEDTVCEPEKGQRQKPKPNTPDPQEVQYPGYFKGRGSL